MIQICSIKFHTCSLTRTEISFASNVHYTHVSHSDQNVSPQSGPNKLSTSCKQNGKTHRISRIEKIE